MQSSPSQRQCHSWTPSSRSFMAGLRSPTHHASFLMETVDAAPCEAVVEGVRRNKERSYWLDWLRIVAIYLVMCFHVAQCLTELGLWKKPGELLGVTNYMATSLQFGMPVFFHISGRAQAFAKPTSLRNMAQQRAFKLLLPAVVAYFLLIPNREYIFDTTALCFSPTCNLTQSTAAVAQREPWGGRDPSCRCVWTEGFPFNYGRYIVHYFTPGVYRFNIGWLWFLPTLFGISLVSGPIFIFAETGLATYRAIACSSWLFQVIVAKVLFDYYWAFLFFCIFGSVSATALVSLVPFPPREAEVADQAAHNEALAASSRQRWLAARALTAVHMITCVGIVSCVWYRHPDGTPFQSSVGPACFLNIIFYQHGYFIQRWDAESMTIVEQDARPQDAPSAFTMCKWGYQVVLLWTIFLLLCLSSPIGKMEEMIYPIYSASFEDGPFFGVFHVLGTWCYVEMAVQMFRAFCDRQINAWLYMHAAKSTIVVYIFHWMFAAIVAYWVLYPAGMVDGDVWRAIDPLILLALTACGAIGVYIICVKCPWIGCVFGL